MRKTPLITLTVLSLFVLVALAGVLPVAFAQTAPSAAVSLSPSGTVEPGTAITATMSFSGLAFDSDTSTTDYAFRADVTGASECEGSGLGRTRYFYKVDEDPEVRTGTISASCPAGDYTIRTTISTPQSVALAAATASFTVAEPTPAPTPEPTPEPVASPTASIALSPSDAVEEGNDITATMSFGGLTSDADTSDVDYIFRADVVDADDCEGGGGGIGFDRYMYKVDEDPETRTGTIPGDCPAGAYTLRVSISSADNTELASASAGFFILRAPVVIEPPTLTTLSVSRGDPAVGVGLTPAFDSETLEYSADVDVERVTIAPTASDADAAVAYLDGNGDAIADADAGADGQQVNLEAGSNTVKVAVSNNGLTTTYAVALFRLVTQQQHSGEEMQLWLGSDSVSLARIDNGGSVSSPWKDYLYSEVRMRNLHTGQTSHVPYYLYIGTVRVGETDFVRECVDNSTGRGLQSNRANDANNRPERGAKIGNGNLESNNEARFLIGRTATGTDGIQYVIYGPTTQGFNLGRDCPTGDYELKARLVDNNDVEVATATGTFSVIDRDPVVSIINSGGGYWDYADQSDDGNPRVLPLGPNNEIPEGYQAQVSAKFRKLMYGDETKDYKYAFYITNRNSGALAPTCSSSEEIWAVGESPSPAKPLTESGFVMFDTARSMFIDTTGSCRAGRYRVTAKLYDGTTELASDTWDFTVTAN